MGHKPIFKFFFFRKDLIDLRPPKNHSGKFGKRNKSEELVNF